MGVGDVEQTGTRRKSGSGEGANQAGVGDLTGDQDLKSEGQADEASGEVQEAVGQFRRKAGDALEKIARRVKT